MLFITTKSTEQGGDGTNTFRRTAHDSRRCSDRPLVAMTTCIVRRVGRLFRCLVHRADTSRPGHSLRATVPRRVDCAPLSLGSPEPSVRGCFSRTRWTPLTTTHSKLEN